METVIKELKNRVRGTVLTEPREMKRYSRDQSIFSIQPKCVVIPDDTNDIVETVQLAADAEIPVTPRGGGSGTAGAGLGDGIVMAIDRKCPINRIVDFRASEKSPEITVESGAIHDRVQDFLRERGFYLPSDPSSGAICMIGGNIATKASGPHALKHGSIDRYLKHLSFVSNRGEVIDTSDETTIPQRIAMGVSKLAQSIAQDETSSLRLNQRKDKKIASGYNLFPLLSKLPMGELIAQLLVGSIGTLGVVTRAILKAEPYIEGRATVVVSFEELREAGDAVSYIRDQGVAAIELISANTVRLVRERRNRAFDTFTSSGHLLLIEFEGDDRFDQIESVIKILKSRNYSLESDPFVATDELSQSRLWKDRKQLLPAIINYKPDFKALSVVNDVGIDVEYLSDFILEIEEIFYAHGLVGAIYGHAGSGNLHLRPLFDTRRPDLKSLIQRVADDVYQMVFKYDGTITAEHGMGRLRAPYLEAEWGATIVQYMRQVKEIFDPEGWLNPGVMLGSNPITECMGIGE